MTGRNELLHAIDALAAAAHGGDKRAIELRRLDARAVVLIHLRPASINPCDTCGVECGSVEHLEEHVYHVHDGPRPEHWLEDEAEHDA